jgi:hypothetical protein
VYVKKSGCGGIRTKGVVFMRKISGTTGKSDALHTAIVDLNLATIPVESNFWVVAHFLVLQRWRKG